MTNSGERYICMIDVEGISGSLLWHNYSHPLFDPDILFQHLGTCVEFR
jgi:hypothetical protein